MTIFYYKGEQKRRCDRCQKWIDEIPKPVDNTAFGNTVLESLNICEDCIILEYKTKREDEIEDQRIRKFQYIKGIIERDEEQTKEDLK